MHTRPDEIFRFWVLHPATRGYPGEQNRTLLKGFVRPRGTCSPMSGLHVLIAIQTLLTPLSSVRLNNLVWGTAGGPAGRAGGAVETPLLLSCEEASGHDLRRGTRPTTGPAEWTELQRFGDQATHLLRFRTAGNGSSQRESFLLTSSESTLSS